jgi:hypothetical protein
MRIAQFTPAETLFIRDGSSAMLKDLLRLTLMDLLLKQVLAIEEIERQPSPRDPVKAYRYIGKGKTFFSHKVLPHENVFISAFDSTKDRKFLFRNLVKISYENSESFKSYQTRLMESPNLHRLFERSFLQSIFGGFTYSTQGQSVQKEVLQNISQLETIIPKLMVQERSKGIEILKSIGGNVFLLTGLNFALAREIEEIILQESSKRKAAGGCAVGCFVYADYAKEFDSSCATDSGSDWSGCSGCSGGDSGCSGCGGGD